MKYSSRELSIIILFSALGAALSVPVGYLGNYLKTVPGLPLGSGQILAGIHIIPIMLTLLFVKKPWSPAMTGAVKGLVEAVLISFHGFPVMLMSGLQGLIVGLVAYSTGSHSATTMYLGCGLASMSNVAFLQFFVGMPFPWEVFALMYILAFASGVILGGYLGETLYRMVGVRLPRFR